MVTAIVFRLGQRRPVCFARPSLNRAACALDRGDVIAAGCLLHEATGRLLIALCEAHDIKPGRSLRRVIRQLLAANVMTADSAVWLREFLDYGERCQRCRRVDAMLIETCISLLHLLLDCATELELPTRGGAV